MTEQEALALMQEGAGIDAGEQAHAEAAASGMLDQRGGIIAPDPDAKAMEWMFVPEILSFFACHLLPECAPAYTKEANLNLARAFVPVAEKYGWNGVASPEISLALASFAFSMPAVMAYRERKERAQAEAKAREEGGNGS